MAELQSSSEIVKESSSTEEDIIDVEEDAEKRAEKEQREGDYYILLQIL